MGCVYVVAVLFAVAVDAQQAPHIKSIINSMALSASDYTDAYNGLDMKRNGKIDHEDLEYMLYHKEGLFVKDKFMQLIETQVDKVVTPDELNAFLNKKPVTAAVYECHYVNSMSLREYCYADQVLTYTYLVLDANAIKAFFDYINVDKSPEICLAEVANLRKLNNKFTDSEQKNFMLEVGGTDDKISLIEFSEYVSQEELLDDFRRCRKAVKGCSHVYDSKCLAEELIHYTMNQVSEMDVATVFAEMDTNKNLFIEKDDLKNICEETVAASLIKIMDKSKEGSPGKDKVSYGEFRTYIMAHTVKMHLERECAVKQTSQAAEIQCYKTEIFTFARENHTPIWLRTPDIDMLFLFEELDTTNNGQISVQADLVDGKKWVKAVAQRMVYEMDGPDADKDVNLEEFNEYVDMPNMVFALADCMGVKRNTRVACYENELKKIMTVMLDKSEVLDMFDFIDQDNDHDIEADDLQKIGIEGKEAENFLKEIGMGDMKITSFEFLWFNRQQELSQMFRDAQCADNNALLMVLLKYLYEIMTEYDILELFKALDKNRNYELEVCDFNANKEKVEKLLKRMDLEDRDDTVNLVEFWLYLNTPVGMPRKRHLEEKCTKPKPTQADEIECYKTEILEVGANEQ